MRARSAVQVGACVALLLVVLVGVRWCYVRSRGVEVRIHNASNRPLSSVVLLVTRRSYQIGDLPPDATSAVFVHPTSESGVGISFADPQGHAKRLHAGGYFEDGYSGSISIDVTADLARIVEDNVSP